MAVNEWHLFDRKGLITVVTGIESSDSKELGNLIIESVNHLIEELDYREGNPFKNSQIYNVSFVVCLV